MITSKRLFDEFRMKLATSGVVLTSYFGGPPRTITKEEYDEIVQKFFEDTIEDWCPACGGKGRIAEHSPDMPNKGDGFVGSFQCDTCKSTGKARVFIGTTFMMDKWPKVDKG